MLNENWYIIILATILMVVGLWHIDIGVGGMLTGYKLMGFFGSNWSPNQTYHIGIIEVIISWIGLLYFIKKESVK